MNGTPGVLRLADYQHPKDRWHVYEDGERQPVAGRWPNLHAWPVVLPPEVADVPDDPAEALALSIHDVGLDARLAQLLDADHVWDLADLCDCCDESLLMISCVGAGALREIDATLARYGLRRERG